MAGFEAFFGVGEKREDRGLVYTESKRYGGFCVFIVLLLLQILFATLSLSTSGGTSSPTPADKFRSIFGEVPPSRGGVR